MMIWKMMLYFFMAIARKNTRVVYCFSNFYPAEFEYKRITYHSVENFYQAHKALDYPKIFLEIATASAPTKALKLGRRHAEVAGLPAWWEEEIDGKPGKYYVMAKALMLKFTTHHFLRQLLLSTGNQNIYEKSERDMVWGYRGRNLLGILLQQLREALRYDKEIYTEKYATLAESKYDMVVLHRDRTHRKQ